MGQWEVMYSIFLLDPAWFLNHLNDMVTIWPPVKGYFATYHVKQEAVREMRARGLRIPLEVAHSSMAPRAIPIIWKLGVQPVVQKVSLRDIRSGTHLLYQFDPESVQGWTRSLDKWIFRETIGRLLHIVMHILPESFHAAVPFGMREKIPGNWIRFTPPRFTV
jgi:hypothetical protein